MYLKGYRHRFTRLLIAVATISLALILCFYGLFRNDLTAISAQLSNYDSADYNTIYLLNYGKRFENECIFPDTDIQFFIDADKTTRLSVISVMKEDNAVYTLDYLDVFSEINGRDICISENTAKQYAISSGDVIYAEYPYSSVLVPLTVKKVCSTEFDYLNPDIERAVGVVFVGYNKQYEDSTVAKYLLFAKTSKVDSLAKFPQIIGDVINKSKSKSTMIMQAAPCFEILLFFTVMAMIAAHMLFFRKSEAILKRCYLKGMSIKLITLILFFEKFVFCVVPCAVIQYLMTSTLEAGCIRTAYLLFPVIVYGIYCIVSFVAAGKKFSKKGCKLYGTTVSK